MRIGLITTGECEQRGLISSLARVFDGCDVDFETCFTKPVHSFTSSRVSYSGSVAKTAPTLLDGFVANIAASITDRKRSFDYVFAIDDLELVNIAAPAQVVGAVRAAVVASPSRSTHKEVETFQERCSVHFLCPMVEAYFFGEVAALTRGGAVTEAILEPGRDLESLKSADPRYLFNFPNVHEHRWRTDQRAEHPKRYLCYLNDPEDEGERKYREGKQGVRALATLDWAQVFAYQPPGLPFVRSFFDDLADAIGVEAPFPGPRHPLTERKQGGVLRNI
jgi:hypothetical protein